MTKWQVCKIEILVTEISGEDGMFVNCKYESSPDTEPNFGFAAEAAAVAKRAVDAFIQSKNMEYRNP